MFNSALVSVCNLGLNLELLNFFNIFHTMVVLMSMVHCYVVHSVLFYYFVRY
jgi:hypothetical protein